MQANERIHRSLLKPERSCKQGHFYQDDALELQTKERPHCATTLRLIITEAWIKRAELMITCVGTGQSCLSAFFSVQETIYEEKGEPRRSG